MKIIRTLTILFCLYSFTIHGQSLFDYDTASNAQHIGFYFSPGINMNGFFMENKTGSGSAKGSNSLVLEAGGYFQVQFSKKAYLKGSLGFGIAGFGINYKDSYKPTSDTSYPVYADHKQRIPNRLPYAVPGIAFGKYFIIRKYHILDVALGVSAPLLLSRDFKYGDTTISKTNIKDVGTATYSVYSKTLYGYEGKSYFANATLYIGLRSLGYSDFFDRLGAGLQLAYTVFNSSSGFTDIIYDNISYQYTNAKQTLTFSNASISLKLSYDIF